jgi:ubiquinone/menaquinone biosynthesis C-methylase UbiE
MMLPGQTAVSSKQVAAHYESVDPHRKVAGSKKSFFTHALEKIDQPGNDRKSLLDVGCGYGYFLRLAADRNWEVTGVEIAQDAVGVARNTIGKENIHHGNLRSASLPPQHFDAVTLWDVLVLAQDPAEDLSECFRILKPGGTVGLRVRNVTFQRWLHRLYVPLQPVLMRIGVKRPYVFHPRNFSTKALQALLNRIGYTDIRITNSPLTKGDPYETVQWTGAVGKAKWLIKGLSNAVYRWSAGRWVIGPSLLVWAVKPGDRQHLPPRRNGRTTG